ncbi:MAG: DNA-binding transcriptional regulator [Akkermansiaceae bacterium]|nr:DNA-binding transcriptional regulator [Akkermansiaceae bacterium]
MSIAKKLIARPVVALLIETSNSFSRELLHGIRDWMREHDSWAIHLSEQGRGGQPPTWLESWRGDGIIARIENEAIASAVRACDLPTVNVSASDLTPEFPSVNSDSAAITQQAATHLLERGLRHFAYCGDERFAWSQRHRENLVTELRNRGYECQVFPSTSKDSADWVKEQAKIARWLKSLPKPVGVMACYDIRGQQVLDACRAIGLRVPDDVAVIGQHNDDLLCELCDPPLSSVIPNARRVGFKAATILDELMRGHPVAEKQIKIPPLGIFTRQSTDLVAVEDDRLARAMRFIHEHAYESISIEDIAQAAGISRSLLERKFRKIFGFSPWDHVTQLRLRKAKHLLAETHLRIAEIAERAGFGTPEYFSAAFRKLTGISPRSARNRGS